MLNGQGKKKKRLLDKLVNQVTAIGQSIETMQEVASDISDQILILIVPDTKRFYDYVIGHWECKKSPIGECVYDKKQDPAYDDCIFCHSPDERA